MLLFARFGGLACGAPVSADASAAWSRASPTVATGSSSKVRLLAPAEQERNVLSGGRYGLDWLAGSMLSLPVRARPFREARLASSLARRLRALELFGGRPPKFTLSVPN